MRRTTRSRDHRRRAKLRRYSSQLWENALRDSSDHLMAGLLNRVDSLRAFRPYPFTKPTRIDAPIDIPIDDLEVQRFRYVETADPELMKRWGQKIKEHAAEEIARELTARGFITVEERVDRGLSFMQYEVVVARKREASTW